MEDLSNPEKKKILKHLDKMEAFAQGIIETATAVRKELDGNTNTSGSARKGKEKAAAMAVLKNRRTYIHKNKKDNDSI